MDLILLAAAAVSFLMLALWLIHLWTGNASVVDPGWALGIALVASIYAFLGRGWPLRSGLIAFMAGVWGVRLGGYLLFTRVIGKPEEGRYQELRRKWGTRIKAKFFVFFQSQALACILLSAPFYLAARNRTQALHPLEYVGFGLWLIGLVGETISDLQLTSWLANRENRGRTCRTGLWRYSRHPNYFFESLVWIGYAVFAMGSPGGFLALSAPALILYLLFQVTGIPATEAQAIRTRGDDYRAYQGSTSMFIPWPPKRGT